MAVKSVVFVLLLFLAGLFQAAAADDDASWCAASGQSVVPQAECQALEAFYNSTNGAGWLDNSRWLDSTAVCSDWTGVTCHAGQVSGLTLVGNGLSGQLPDSLGDLSHLTTLDLTGNRISGPIPPQLGRLAALNDLSLGANLLQGSIPAELGQLRALFALDLGGNRLDGSIPAELGALANLSLLYLDGNRLEGPLPPAVCELTPLLASVDYNKLDIFGSGEACDAPFAGWQETQTAPPAGVSVASLGVSTIAGSTAVRGDVLLKWIPPAYDGDGGGYELLTRHRASGEIESRGRTEDKTADSMQVTIAGDPRAYAYFVRMQTAAHAANRSSLTSADSDEVEIGFVAARKLDSSPNLPLLYLPALAPLVILLLVGIAIIFFRRG